MLGGRTVSPLLIVTILLLTLGACTDDPPTSSAPDPVPTTQGSEAPLIEVPEVTNTRSHLATETITEAGLEMGPVERVGDGTKRIVLEQHPAAGTMVPPGTLITLVVSKLFPIPLLDIRSVGGFGWTCKGDETLIEFTVEEFGASTHTTLVTADGQRASRILHPGQTLKSPAGSSGSQRWTLVQATKPRTVRSEVSIVPQQFCESYVPPQVALKTRARSHSIR